MTDKIDGTIRIITTGKDVSEITPDGFRHALVNIMKAFSSAAVSICTFGYSHPFDWFNSLEGLRTENWLNRTMLDYYRERFGSIESIYKRESAHFAWPEEKRREIVLEYQTARSKGLVENQGGWAQRYNISGRTLGNYLREFPGL